MTPLIAQRGVWIPLLVVVFSWLAVGRVLSQDKPPASQPTKESAAKEAGDDGKAAAPPASQPTRKPATYPATQEAQERFARWQEMEGAAAKNGKGVVAAPPRHPASKPALEKPPLDKSKMTKEERERRLVEMRARREEARRRVLEERGRRQAAVHGTVRDEQRQAIADKHKTRKEEPALDAPPPSSPPYGSSPWKPVDEPVKVTPPPAKPEEAAVASLPAADDGRDYFIAFKDMPWEDVIRHYAKLVGKPLMGDVMPFGELTYESPRRFTKEEMLDELNFLLLEQGDFVIEKEDYIYLLPTSELTKELSLDRVFDSLAVFEAANLRDLEICSALIQIKDRPATEVRDMLSPSMPDRALPVVVGDTNQIKITGLAQDVRRFVGLLNVVETKEYDPRQTRFIKVETNVREIERMVREYFKVSQPRRQYDREKRQFVTVGGESEVVIIADERTKNLIVKATPAKLVEIEEFIQTIDQKPDIGEFKTTVIPIRYGSATDIANLLNQILQQEQGQRARTPVRPPTRTRTTRGRTQPRRTPQRTQQPTPEDIIVEDLYERAKKTVRIVADERTNNLIVYANEDGLKRVTEILEQIDQSVPSNFKTFKLEHAEAEQIQPTIDQVARSLVTGTRGRTGRAPTVLADRNLNVLHVLAEREQMNRIEAIIQELDVDVPEDEWHFVELKNITASDAARMIAPILDGGVVGPTRRPARGRRGPVRVRATSQTIPLDEANTLIVICSQEEWEKAEKILKIADENAVSLKPELKFFEIKNGNPQSIASTLGMLYRSYQHPVLGRSQVLVATEGKQLIVQGVQPALEEIEALLPTLDVVPEESPLVILPLVNADATQVAQIAQGLLPPEARARGGRRGTGGPGASLQAEPVTNSLIIQADKLTVDRIKAFAADMDQQVAAQKPERRYYSLKNATPREVVGAIGSLFGATGGYRRGRGPVGTQVKTVIVGNQVVVDAPAGKQAEIAALVEQLDSLSDKGVTTLLVKLPGADIRSIAGRLTNAFRDRVRQQGVIARFEADNSTESILMTCSKDILEDAESLLNQYKDLTSEHVWQTEFHQLKYATADAAARWLREQLVAMVTQQIGSSAARQIKVTGDQRTNRVIINAPQVAVKQGLLLLDQYDRPTEEMAKPPVEVWTVKLTGLDVRSLASNLQKALNNMPRRPDRLKAVVTADQLTNNIILSAPKDMKAQIDELIAKFSAETADLTQVQKFIPIENADANYIAGQVRRVLGRQVEHERGRGVAQQISVEVDTRLNRLILNTPKFALEMAEALIAELDQKPTTESQLHTIPLVNADAGTVLGILNTIFREKIRARTLQISVEPLTNSLIVGGTKEDFEDIRQWTEELDAKAVQAVGEPVIIEFKNANPWEVYNVLNATFVHKARGRRVQPGKEIKMSIIADRSIVVQAPPEKLKEIQELAAKLDEIGQNSYVVRTYKLPGLGAQLNQFARQIQNAVNGQMKTREQRVSITALPAADTLVVTATEQQLPNVEKAMEQFKVLYEPHKIETIALLNADANAVYQALSRVLQPKIRAGKMQFGVEGLTNSLIVSANEEDMAEIKEWVAKFDKAAADAIVPPRIFELKNASPWEVRSVLNATFLQSGSARRRQGMEIRFDVIGGRSIVAKAPAEKMKQIEELINKLDELVSNKAEVRTYKVPGMGSKLNEFARQIERSVNSQVQARDRRISVAAYPAADVLIVTAQQDQFEMIQQAMDQFKDIYEPGRIETIALKNGDANTVYQALSRVLQPKIRAGKIQLSVEGMTNSLIVLGGEEDIAEIRKWAETFDEAAAASISPPRIFELKNANPWEVRNVLTATFVPRGASRRQAGKEVRFDVMGGRSIVAMAPAEKMKQIETLITALDEIGSNQAEVRTYELVGMGNRLNDFARQLQNALNLQATGRERRVSVTAYAPADALIVTAQPDQFEQVEQMMEQFKPLMDVKKAKTEFFKLEYVDATQIVGTVQSLVQTRLRTGGRSSRGAQEFSVTADPRTNRLIVFAPESIMPDVRAVVQELDVEVEEDNVVTIELKYADPWETRNMINDVFGNRGRRARDAATEQVYVTVNNNMLIVKAPPKKLEQIQDLLDRIDCEDLAGLQVKTYQLKVLNAQTVAGQVQMFLRAMGGVSRRGQMQPGAFAEPTTNSLVVIAPTDKLPFIDGLIAQIEALGEGETASTEAYVLKNARADQVQHHVDQMLKAKVAEKEGFTRGRSVQQKTVVMAEPETNRLFVFAPRPYQELAAEMIKMIDEEIDTGEIMHIISLENGDAAQVAQTVTQTMQGGGPRVRGAAPMKVKVVPDPGSNSIILSGLPKDVAEVENLVKDLEVASDTVPEIQYFTLENAMAFEVAEALRGIFPPSRSAAETVTVSEDEYYNRLLVTANKRKMRQVEAVVAQLDTAPEEQAGSILAGGKELYFIEIGRGDAWEIAYDVSDFFPPADRGGPDIEADWFGEYIRVVCRPSEFPRVERLIRQFEKRAKPEIVIRAVDFSGDWDRLNNYLQLRELDYQLEQAPHIKGLESIIIDLHPEDEDKGRAEKGKPRAQAVPRGGAPHLFGGVVLTALLQVEDALGQQPPADTAPATTTGAELEMPRRELPTVQRLPDGRVIIRGSRDAVDEIEDAISLFEEDLSRGEVIRIFRFRYGDVNAASRILDMMFNERAVRLPQQRQQQQQQPQQRGQRGKEGEQKGQQQGLMQQIQQMIGGRGQPGGRGVTGGQRVRIATDASHNYLLVKCDEALLPDITQLLRELDIKPADVEIEVFQLKNLEAAETANNIKEVLGITKSRTRRPTQQPRGRSPQQQLMEVLQQQMVSLAGGEGSAKIESVEIVPNTITNSLLVSAPPEVMNIIRDVIIEMELLEGGDVVVIKHYLLEEAKVDDVLPLLQEIFGATGGGRGGRAGRGGSPADLGPVTISGDPRSNTIIYVAQAKDVDTVEEQIGILDIQGAIAEVEMYICKYGDAVGIAQAVSEMFVTGARGGGRRGPRGGAQPAGMDVRITAEPATNTILVFAPEDKRELILKQIESLDRENRFDIREIPVVFAKPQAVADKLIQIFGGSGGSALSGGRGGRAGGPRRQAAQTQGRIVVVPDENGKKLLVRAPDQIFDKMKELVELLDQPSEQLLIRTFSLKHADAQVVVESVKNALMEFMQFQRQLGGGELDIDAFTAVADPRTNSVVVVGSEETFMFVQEMIAAVDRDTPPDQQKQFRIFVLDRADAQIVAEAINSFAAGGAAGGAAGPGGRRPGGRRGMGGPALTTGAIIDVQAMADPTTNSVMVYGRPDDIDLVEQVVIEELEGTLSARFEFATIEVKEALPTQLISYIQPFLDQMGGQGDPRGGRRGAAATTTRQGPRLIGNDNAKTIVVYGSKRQIEEVRTLVARFDNKDTLLQQHEIISVPWGQDAVVLAAMVQDLVNTSEQENASITGRQPRLVTVSADEHSNAIIAFGEPAQTALVKTVIDQLQKIHPEKPVTRIIELINLSSAEAEQLINDLQQRRGSSGRIRRPSSTPRRSTPGSSGRTRGSRRRSWNWDPSPNGVRYSAAPAGFATPFVGTAGIGPSLMMALTMQAAEPEQPQAEQPVAQKPLTPREEKQQAMLSSISGQLRGEIIATPLDSRRIIVTGDQEDVDFIVQMLALMERSTPEPVIEVFTLVNSKAAAIAPVLEQTLRALIAVKGGGDRVDAFSIVAEARSNSLIVSASEPNMNIIEEIIGKLDVETLKDTQTRLVPLKHIRASEAFELLQDAIKRLNDMREVPASAQATIQAVERSNAILVVGTPADISEIERIIEGIDVDLPPEQEFTTAKIMIVDLKNAQAEDLADTLTEIIEMEKASRGGGQGGRSRMPLLRRLILTTADGRELPPLDLDKPIVIYAEKGKNSLIIFSSEKNSEALLEIVGLFDQLPVGEEVEVKSFGLTYANAEQVAELLQDMFDEGKTALKRPSEGDAKGLEKGVMPPVPPGLAGRGLPYNVAVSHDARSNTVIVIGRKDAVLLAAGLITELDRPSADLSIRPYVVHLKNIQATALQEKLDDILKERLDALGSDKNEARDSAILSADDRSNTLIVLATPEIFTMVEDLAVQLDGAEPYSVVDSEFRRLEYADAAKLAGLLQELFDKKKDADRDVTEGGQKNVLFVFADARSNSLMLTGTRDYLLEASGLVDRLDQAFDPTVQFKLRPIRLNSAANIATLLEEMIQESRREQAREMQGTPIYVGADPYSNSLLLAASTEDMLMLERWIDVLDRPAEPGRITRIIPLKRGGAEDLARSAQELFQTQARGAEADVTVTHDQTTNSIIAIGPPAVVNDIEDFVTKLNAAEGAGAVVKIFPLEQADAEDAGELLRSILEGRGGSVGGGTRGGSSRQEEFNQVMLIFQRDHPELGLETLKALRAEIVVIDDVRTNSLVVTAPPESMPLMESLVAAIDVPPQAAKIRVFKLRNSDAEDMVQTLEELFQTEQAGTRGGGAQGEEEMRLTLGGLGEGGRQRLAFTVDTRTNSVIAAGTTGYLDLVDELILKLDSQPIEERKTIVYQPANNEAVAIQQAIREYSDTEQSRLDEIGEEISVSEKQRRAITAIASEDTNRIILDYDPRREGDVLDLVRDLDQPPGQVMIQVLIVEVTMDNSLELGVEFAFQDLQWTKAGPTDTTTFDFVGGTDIGAAGTGLGGFTFTVTGADFNFLIRTLQNEGSLNILSRPQIMAMDNLEARIEISQDVPYVSGTATTTGGQITTSVARQDVGIILEVTPHINPDGFVRMEIRQEVSDLTGSTIDVGQGITAPIFFKREAETTVTVRDNETVVLGGLITSRDESRAQKIPILGDIPLLGLLFSHDLKETKHNELLLILTPRIVRTVEDYRELSAQERDRTGELPGEVLTSELMNELRVLPEELTPAEGEALLGPFPETSESAEPEEQLDEDVYGPLRSSSSDEQQGEGDGDPDSYDIPISWAGYSSNWAEKGAKRSK